MKKSNNKRTKRLRLKYKKTKTKRNIKRRTLRKTRHRQRFGGGLPTTKILTSDLPVGRLILRNVLESLRQGAHKLGQETIKAVDKTFTAKSVKPFGQPTEPQKTVPVLQELLETIKTKAKGKLLKEGLDNCLFGKDKKAELAPEGVRYARLYSTRTAIESSKDFKNPFQYPINISSANFKLLLEEINSIPDNDLPNDLPNDERIKKKINKFVETIIAEEEKSKCEMSPEKKKSESPVLSPSNVDMPPHVRKKSNRSRLNSPNKPGDVKRTLNF